MHPYPPPPPAPPQNRNAIAVLVVAFVGLFLAVAVVGGFFILRDDSDKTDRPITQRSLPSEITKVTGTWEGTYSCGQGPTKLILTIDPGTRTPLKATFDFSAPATNPDVPSGSFTLTGTVRNDTLTLDPDKWITRPPGWEMVGLTGKIGPSGTIEGNITNAACTTFELRQS